MPPASPRPVGVRPSANAGADDRRRLVVVAVVAAAAVFVAATVWLVVRRGGAEVVPPTVVDEAGPGPTDDVALVGDSITELSEPRLRQELGGTYRLRVRARGGYRIDQLEPYAVEVAATRPEQVIVNVGTNDVLQGWPTEASATALGRMLDDFRGTRCVAVVTVNEQMADPTDTATHDRAVAFNAEVRRLAAARGITVIDWAATVEGRAADGAPGGTAGEALTVDRVHPSEAGQRALTGLYRDVLDRCAPG